PDGLAFGPDGLLYVACYEPSQIVRVLPDGHVQVIAHDPTAHVQCHPTNLAFRGSATIADHQARRHVAEVSTNWLWSTGRWRNSKRTRRHARSPRTSTRSGRARWPKRASTRCGRPPHASTRGSRSSTSSTSRSPATAETRLRAGWSGPATPPACCRAWSPTSGTAEGEDCHTSGCRTPRPATPTWSWTPAARAGCGTGATRRTGARRPSTPSTQDS